MSAAGTALTARSVTHSVLHGELCPGASQSGVQRSETPGAGGAGRTHPRSWRCPGTPAGRGLARDSWQCPPGGERTAPPSPQAADRDPHLPASPGSRKEAGTVINKWLWSAARPPPQPWRQWSLVKVQPTTGLLPETSGRVQSAAAAVPGSGESLCWKGGEKHLRIQCQKDLKLPTQFMSNKVKNWSHQPDL